MDNFRKFWSIIGATVLTICTGCGNNVERTSQVPSPVPTAKPSNTPTPKNQYAPGNEPWTEEQVAKFNKEMEASERAAARQERKKGKGKKRPGRLDHLANAAYNVPALFGKTIEQVRATLGPVEDSGSEDDDGEMSWSKSTGGLLVHYNTSTRRATTFFVSDQYSQPLTDKNRFLTMGNLRENDPRYTLEFVPLLGSTTEWMGVRVIPN